MSLSMQGPQIFNDNGALSREALTQLNWPSLLHLNVISLNLAIHLLLERTRPIYNQPRMTKEEALLVGKMEATFGTARKEQKKREESRNG